MSEVRGTAVPAGPPAAWVAGAPPTPRRRPRLLVAVIVIVVVVALAGVGVWAWVTRDPGARPGWANSPRGAVQGYLTAVADGHAADALAYLSSPPADRTYLTDAVLAQSHDLAPLTQIVVGDAEDPYRSDGTCTSQHCTVQVEYRLGDQKTETELEVSERNGYWFVDNQPERVKVHYDSVGRYKPEALVNGTPLVEGINQGFRAVLFPGRYRVTSGHAMVDIDTTFTVDLPELGHEDDLVVELHPVLTDDAQQRITEAAQDQLDACLAQASFATECRFLELDPTAFDGPADPSTISWSLVGDATMPGPGDHLATSDRTVGLAVEVPIEIQPRCTWTTAAGQPLEWEPILAPDYYIADITDPERITVTFVKS